MITTKVKCLPSSCKLLQNQHLSTRIISFSSHQSSITSKQRTPQGTVSAKLAKTLQKHSNFIKTKEVKPFVHQSQRDNEWIGLFLNDYKQDFEVLNDVLKIGDSLYTTDEQFRDAIDIGLFELTAYTGKKKFIEQFKNQELVNQHLKVANLSFEQALAKSLKDYKSPESYADIKLEDLISPTIERLPHIIFHINQSPQPTIIIKYFMLKDITTPKQQTLEVLQLAHKSHTLNQTTIRTPAQEIKVDIRNPSEWYPSPRKIRRKLILHVGPTNSGKTHTALQRLKECEKGYFAGPLRLLAREIYERFKSDGLRCNLITGEEIIKDLDDFGNQANLSSGTIEMIDLNSYFDVVVLDEIQMIGDKDRGWAWTNALLGVKSKEVHLCGEASVVPLVKRIAEMTGDEVIVNEYQRLGELRVEDKHLKGIQDLQRGDCIVVFSKKRILAYKTEIERLTDLKCAVVYGALPAETRVVQASKFNKGEFDVLIATDAIGMGLNLKINRIIFDDHKKFDGKANRPIETPQVKQIAGRAGRFKVAPSSTYKDQNAVDPEQDIKDMEVSLNDSKDTTVGYVSAFHPATLRYVRDNLAMPSKPLFQGYVWPSDSLWAHYMSEFIRGTSFVEIIRKFSKEVGESKNFIIADIENRISMVSEFEKIKGLMIADQLKISTAPVSSRLPGFENVIYEFCQSVAKSQSKTIFQYDSLDFSVLEEPIPVNGAFLTKEQETGYKELLANSEVLHKYVMVWLWMNIRYPTLFVDRESAVDVKNLLEERIEDLIDNLKGNDSLTKRNDNNWAAKSRGGNRKGGKKKVKSKR